jgi:hypothetical protein
MGPLDRAKVLPRAGEVGSKAFELFEVESGQNLQSLGTLFSELQTDDPMVVFVSGPGDQTCSVSTVDETDRAVVEKEQVVGDLADGRATRITVSTYRQQELMLGGSEIRGAGLALAPTFEMPQPSPETCVSWRGPNLG